MTVSDTDRMQSWRRDGYFVVPQHLEEVQLEGLMMACDHVLDRVRARSTAVGHTTTHVAGLLAPDHFSERPELLANLVQFLSSRKVLSLIHDLGRGEEGPPVLHDTHYFHEPSERDFHGAWHRDTAVPTAPLKSEFDKLNQKQVTMLRYRIAFSIDDHLEYVPGSHARADTPEELHARTGAVRNAQLDLGQRRIQLQAGDVCVFDVAGVHRARYSVTDRAGHWISCLASVAERARSILSYSR